MLKTQRQASSRKLGTDNIMDFKYGKKEMDYLKSRDRRLGEVIERIGRIRWTVEPDLFSAVVQNIVAQQK